MNHLPDWSKHTILLVDDVAINRMVAAMILDDTNIRIVPAEDGRQAVDKFKASPERFDLILMDVQMPVLDGLEATKEIRSIGEKGKAVPIISMTAAASNIDITACTAVGMNDHVLKPIVAEQFFSVLGKYLV